MCPASLALVLRQMPLLDAVAANVPQVATAVSVSLR